MQNIIETKDLCYSYNEDKSVLTLKDLNISIPKGQFVALLGHNGSGKSTLAKHFNAIFLPTGGTCWVMGIDTKDASHLLDIRSAAGMVFQNPDNQIVANVVEEDLAFAPENMGLEPEEIMRRVNKALETVHMEEYRTHAPSLLSGGQKQRIAIAGVLAMKPECIIMDEPTAMLDPQGRRDVLDTIRTLKEENNVTVIMITHDMREAAMADRLIVLSEGTVILDGVPEEVFSKVDLMRYAGLAVPQTIELEYTLRELGFSIPSYDLSIEDCAHTVYRALEEEKLV